MESRRLDQSCEEIHQEGWNWGHLWNGFTQTGKDSLWMGALGLGAATLGLIAVKVAQSSFGQKINSLTDQYIPSFKGALNAGLVIGSSSMVAIPISKFLENREYETLSKIVGALTVFLATTMLTPKVSRQLSTYQVSYLGASLYGMAGAGVITFSEANSRIYSKKRASLWDKFVQTGKDSLWMGALGLGVSSIGLLAVKTTAMALPELWGTLPAGIVTGLTTTVAIPLSHRVANRFTEDKENRELLRIITSFAAALLATALCTTNLSTKISSHRVSYLGALGYSIIGGLAAGAATIFDIKREKEISKKALHEERPMQEFRGHHQHSPQMGASRLSSPQLHQEEEFDPLQQPPRNRRDFSERPLPQRQQRQPMVRSYDRSDYLQIGGLSLAAGAATTVASGALLVLGTLFARLWSTVPMVIKGGATVGAVGGIATSIALVTANFEKYVGWLKDQYDEVPMPIWDFAARVAAVFAVTVAVAPTASKYLSSYQVGYLQTAGMSVGTVAVPAALFFGGISLKEWFES
jgi:hypothetical protein